MSEVEKVVKEENSNEVLTAFNSIPYGLLNVEIDGSAKDTLEEFTQIAKYYKVYREGKEFRTEGTNGDYIPAKMKYKQAAALINKEARFLFAAPPDIKIEPKGDAGKSTEEALKHITNMDNLIKTVLDENDFEDMLLKGAKDCFIGKRVAGLVNFNEEDGITLTFIPATQFIFSTKESNPRVLDKFVAFIVIEDSIELKCKRIFKKKYVLEDDGTVYLEEQLYDGCGGLIEEITPYQPIELKTIPAVIITNDGLTGDIKGESEIELLQDFEAWYSKLSNADKDAERKSMNPTKYVVDMDSRSTDGLSSSAGAFWDLQTDQNLDNANTSVGILEPNMNYSNSLKTTLDRIKTTMYEQVDMPNITLESLQGAITSGKSLKAIYWPLIVRCKEKMKMWGPQLRRMINIIIEGAIAYPNCAKKHIDFPIVPTNYEISILQNTPLPEDEIEEKNMDLSEVESQVMSKKAYMKKWRGLTDDEAQEELEQIALERQIIEDSSFEQNPNPDDDLPYPEV